jgi:hypothetical protein
VQADRAAEAGGGACFSAHAQRHAMVHHSVQRHWLIASQRQAAETPESRALPEGRIDTLDEIAPAQEANDACTRWRQLPEAAAACGF